MSIPSVNLRNQSADGVEIGRLIGAFAIVWLHCAAAEATFATLNWTRIGVPFFTAAVTCFAVRSAMNAGRSTRSFVIDKWLRIGLPFLGWTLIYSLMRVVKRLVLKDGGAFGLSLELLLGGAAVHLWFLPFCLLISLLAFGVGRLSMRWPNSRWLLIFCVLMAMIQLVPRVHLPFEVDYASRETMESLNLTIHLYWDAWFSLWVGILLALAPEVRTWLNRSWLLPALLMLTGVGLTIWLTVEARSGNRFLENLAGSTFFLAALGMRSVGRLEFLASFGWTSYGIYLAHIVYWEIARLIKNRLSLEPSVTVDRVVVVAVYLAAWLTTLALCRSRHTAWLVGRSVKSVPSRDPANR